MRDRNEVIYDLELELEALDEIYVAADPEQTWINYLASEKAGNQYLMNYYHLREDPERLHYEVAFRISALIELIDINSGINFN